MALTYYEIPLTPNAQQFRIALAGVSYLMQLLYRTHEMGGWFLDIATAAGVPLVQGVPLVTGIDLLSAYPEIGFGGPLFVTTDGNPDAVPTYGNLGTASHVYFGAPA